MEKRQRTQTARAVGALPFPLGHHGCSGMLFHCLGIVPREVPFAVVAEQQGAWAMAGRNRPAAELDPLSIKFVMDSQPRVIFLGWKSARGAPVQAWRWETARVTYTTEECSECGFGLSSQHPGTCRLSLAHGHVEFSHCRVDPRPSSSHGPGLTGKPRRAAGTSLSSIGSPSLRLHMATTTVCLSDGTLLSQ